MEKKRMIGKVYKVLKVYEEESFQNYQSCLFKTIKLLTGLHYLWLDDYVHMLQGLFDYGENIVHDEVRTIILHITNGIDRKYDKEVH